MAPLAPGSSGDLTARVAIAVAAVAAMLAFWAWGMVHRQAPHFDLPAQPAPEAVEPLYREHFASNSETREVHAATAYAHGDELTAFWYGGSREGARDVAIYQARRVGEQWGKPKAVVNRKQMKSELNRHIRKIGN